MEMKEEIAYITFEAGHSSCLLWALYKFFTLFWTSVSISTEWKLWFWLREANSKQVHIYMESIRLSPVEEIEGYFSLCIE